MWNLLWPMLMVVGANTVYNICAKSTPEKLNSFAALTINYGVAAALSLLLFFVTTGGEKNLIQEIGKTNWAPVVMGLSVVGLELGYILIYRAGWKVSVASLVANLALACILVLVGVLWYKEVLTGHQILGIGACVVGILVPAPGYVLIPLCFIAAALAGAIWGVIVGFLKTKFGINEVLSMIMFNWIAYYLSNFIADLEIIHDTGSAEATRNVSDAAMILMPKSMIQSLGLCPKANWGIFAAMLAVVLIYVVIDKTTTGYQLEAVGFNRSAAEYAGINVNRSILLALAISGALAGVGGAMQLLGQGGRISIFAAQEGFGFQGISVALIGASSRMPLSSVLAVDGLIAIQLSGANTHNSMRKHRIACIFCQMENFFIKSPPV